MRVTREEFASQFIRWVEKKIADLPEDGFEDEMFERAVWMVGRHAGSIGADLKFPG